MTEAEDSAETPRKRPKPGERRLQILQAIAAMLEEGEAERVTTAALAARLQVSEAALYRHFASKAQMYEGLLEFIEQTIFGLINQIDASSETPIQKARAIVNMLLAFAEKNPGMTRVLIGEAIVFEHARLQQRVNQIMDRIEASLRQTLKPEAVEGGSADPPSQASLAMGFVMGRWLRFAKTGFKQHPAEHSAEILPRLF